MLEVASTTTLDSKDSSVLKTHLKEFSKLIVENPIFDSNNNVIELGNLLYSFLEDLYITEPKEVIDFVNQIPSKKLVTNIFLQYGISTKILNKYPETLKTKTAYYLSQLFEAKGSNKVFDIFNILIREFFRNLNFYNVRVEQRVIEHNYKTPIINKMYYIKLNGEPIDDYMELTSSELNVYQDPKITYKIYTNVKKYEKRVIYKLKFFEHVPDSNYSIESQLYKTPHNIKLTISNDTFIIPKGTINYEIVLRKYDIYSLGERSENQLRYLLDPIIINDPLDVIDTISSTDLRTNKYLMQTQDYFDSDIRNQHKKNVFPIITNALFIQFQTSDSIDAMKQLPDLVRMFSMTYLQDKMFSFQIDNIIIKVPIQEYLQLLVFAKLKQIKINDPDWVWDAPELSYVNLMFPIEDLDDIYKLILYYQDMPHDYKIFKEFKRQYNQFLGRANQLETTKIYNIEQFREFLAGNVPDNFITFFELLDKFYPDGVDFINFKDQNLLLKEKVNFIKNTYKPSTPDELLELISMNDERYIGLENSLHDMLKLNIIRKHPRVVQKIESITDASDFTSLYLLNYKRLIVETSKMDNMIGYFVNDLYKGLIFDSTFKEEFFDPFINLFQQYFFKAELSYQNSDSRKVKVRDKMQQVILGSDASFDIQVKNKFSELNLSDFIDFRLDTNEKNLINFEDNFNITIDRDGDIEVFDSDNDAGYMNGIRI